MSFTPGGIRVGFAVSILRPSVIPFDCSLLKRRPFGATIYLFARATSTRRSIYRGPPRRQRRITCRNHPRERHLPNFPVRIKRRAAVSHRKPVYFCVTISHAVLTRLLFASRILLTFHTRVEIYLSLPRDEIRSPRYDFLLLARMERNKRNNWKEKRLFSNRGGERSRHYGAETRNRRR